jgi:hypothetical protein
MCRLTQQKRSILKEPDKQSLWGHYLPTTRFNTMVISGTHTHTHTHTHYSTLWSSREHSHTHTHEVRRILVTPHALTLDALSLHALVGGVCAYTRCSYFTFSFFNRSDTQTSRCSYFTCSWWRSRYGSVIGSSSSDTDAQLIEMHTEVAQVIEMK